MQEQKGKQSMALVFRQTNRGKIILTAYIVLIWFFLALGASVLGVFVVGPGAPPVLFGLSVGVPVIVFAAGYLFSDAFRSLVRSIVGDPWGITVLQTYRVMGIFF